jgi:hypothetical protein
MRNRMIGCAWILVGTLFVAAGGSLTRLGHYEYLYIAMTIGVAMIFYGVLSTRRPDTRPAPAQQATDMVARPASAVPTVEAEPHPDLREPAMAQVSSLLRLDGAEISRFCAEWSVPADETPVFTRSEARQAWVFRREMPEESQRCFDALPVPVRRQLATLYREVLTWPEDGDGEIAPPPARNDDGADAADNGAEDTSARMMKADMTR